MTYLDHAKRDIQGFITSGYGHTYHAAYLFLRITQVEQAKNWLKVITPQILTAESWRNNARPFATSDQPKPPKVYPERILNIAFSFEGLAALNLSDTVLRTFPPELQQGISASSRSLLLGDVESSAPENWNVGNPAANPFHIMLLLHAGMAVEAGATIRDFVDDLVATLNGVEVVHTEWGYRRDDDKEHFGFRDGIAQPKITGINMVDRSGKPYADSVATGEFILGYLNGYNLYPSVPAVPRNEDPHDILPPLNNPRHVHPLYQMSQLKDLGANGSYIVYRKMRQDVLTFWKFIAEETERLDGVVTIDRMLWLASKMVGRYPNGDPLVSDANKLVHNDDFLYADTDSEGAHCPFGSHIRRTNPRDTLHPLSTDDSLATVAKHRILRRGRLYGASLFDLGLFDNENTKSQLELLLNLEDDKVNRGLHFICVNTNIQRQFEFIQNTWSNNPNFNGLYQNKDAIIGDNGQAIQAPSYMHIPDTPVRVRTKALPRFVTVLDGAYLFMPSITSMTFLST